METHLLSPLAPLRLSRLEIPWIIKNQMNMAPLALLYDEIGVVNMRKNSNSLLRLPRSDAESNIPPPSGVPLRSSIQHSHSISGRSKWSLWVPHEQSWIRYCNHGHILPFLALRTKTPFILYTRINLNSIPYSDLFTTSDLEIRIRLSSPSPSCIYWQCPFVSIVYSWNSLCAIANQPYTVMYL